MQEAATLLILDHCCVQVATKDGVLVLRHDLTLDDSSDIKMHPEFAGRKCVPRLATPTLLFPSNQPVVAAA